MSLNDKIAYNLTRAENINKNHKKPEIPNKRKGIDD